MKIRAYSLRTHEISLKANESFSFETLIGSKENSRVFLVFASVFISVRFSRTQTALVLAFPPIKYQTLIHVSHHGS